jgi:hypothetical protein
MALSLSQDLVPLFEDYLFGVHIETSTFAHSDIRVPPPQELKKQK